MVNVVTEDVIVEVGVVIVKRVEPNVTTKKNKIQKTSERALQRQCSTRKQTHWLTGRQIEAARVAMTRYMQREGQSWIRIFPDKPITKKPADVRMGKGKGDPVGYVFPITPGRIIFEVEGVPFEVAKEALRLAAQKLPITTKFVVRHDFDKNA